MKKILRQPWLRDCFAFLAKQSREHGPRKWAAAGGVAAANMTQENGPPRTIRHESLPKNGNDS
ncbi:MAG: hypothetical protein HQL86_05420 [Magnetococcales bacterium]|nr:hypothetical protein [Magnetococcales bacterium]